MDFLALMDALLAVAVARNTMPAHAPAGAHQEIRDLMIRRAEAAAFAWNTGARTAYLGQNPLIAIDSVSETPKEIHCVIRFSWGAQTWIKNAKHIVCPHAGDRFYLDGRQRQAFKVEAVTHQLGNYTAILDCTVERLDVDDMAKAGYVVADEGEA